MTALDAPPWSKRYTPMLLAHKAKYEQKAAATEKNDCLQHERIMQCVQLELELAPGNTSEVPKLRQHSTNQNTLFSDTAKQPKSMQKQKHIKQGTY